MNARAAELVSVAATGTHTAWRRTIPLVLAALVVGAIVGIAVWNLKPTPQSTPPPTPRPISRFTITLPSPERLRVVAQLPAVALSPDENQLFVVNTPDNTLEIFDIDLFGGLAYAGEVQVGMEPVAVAARSNTEVWVVNFLSDSVSVVDLTGAAPRVVRTLHVGDEPSDIVFAGTGGDRAFITTAHRGQNTPR